MDPALPPQKMNPWRQPARRRALFYVQDDYGHDTRRCCAEGLRWCLNGVFCSVLFVLAGIAVLFLFGVEGIVARALGF